MDVDLGILASEKSTHAHNRTTSANSSDESVGHASRAFQLHPNLRPGGRFVRFGVGIVRKLAWQEHTSIAGREFFRHVDAAQESALLVADWYNLSTIAPDQVLALATHPVRHEDLDWVAESTANAQTTQASLYRVSLVWWARNVPDFCVGSIVGSPR
jgi:hypothetical protein